MRRSRAGYSAAGSLNLNLKISGIAGKSTSGGRGDIEGVSSRRFTTLIGRYISAVLREFAVILGVGGRAGVNDFDLDGISGAGSASTVQSSGTFHVEAFPADSITRAGWSRAVDASSFSIAVGRINRAATF